MATDLGHLKSVRAGHKGAVSRKITDLNTLLLHTPVERDSLERIKLALERKLDLLNKLSEDIVTALTDEGEIIAEIESAEVVSDDIEEALLKIKRALDPPRSTPPPPVIPPTSHPTSPVPPTSHVTSPSPPPVDPLISSSTLTTVPTRTLRVKLPELSLRPFDGNFANWFTFWDTYKAAIHDNSELSDIGKFTYLISLLRQSAKEAIAGLSLTAANYQEAIEILCKRFGDRTQIRANHMEVLMSLEPVMSSHNLIGLRRLYDTIETNIRGLKSLGVDRESYGTLLSPVILKKLPQDLRLIISRQVADEEWNLDSILTILLAEIEARERAGVSNSKPRKDRERPTGVNLYTGSSSSKPSCCYCEGDHSPSQCETVTSVNERQKILRRHGRCYNCLRKGHIIRECKSSSSCKVCKTKHHTSLCQKPTGQSNSGQSGSTNLQISTFELNPTTLPFSPDTSLESSQAVGSSPTSTLHIENENAVLLQTACAVVFNPTNHDFHEEVRVILDCGSQRSYITNSLRKRLQLVSEGKKAMSIMTFGSTKVRNETCDLVRIGVRAKEADFELRLLSVPHICSPVASMPVETCHSKYDYLRELDLADTLPDGELEILIGSDYYWKVVTGERIQGSHGPIAIYTRLGWVLSGPVPCLDGSCSTNLITHVLRVDSGPTFRELDKRLRTFWELESLGVRDSEDIVHEQFCSIVTLREGCYEVSLPWKDSYCTIPDHFELCSRRLNSLLRRLKRTPEILKEYHRIIEQQLENGIVEIVEKPHEVTDGRVHYLPHHAVIRRDKETTKVRIVYDASARDSGPSLNDILYTGPKFNQKIFDILLRFRCHQIALTSDIEKAFLMISIAEKDRNALRFLWVKNPLEEQSDYAVLRFTRVVFGVSSSPFLLNATVHYHLTLNLESQKTLVSKLLRSFYVDDVITGANTVAEAFSLYTESKELMRKGGFNLCKFNTNDYTLQERISLNEGTHVTPETDETHTRMDLNQVQTKLRGERKVLGLVWNVDDDEIVYDLRNVIDVAVEVGPTKRQVVSLTGRFFDPIGVLAPVVIAFKVLIQELCKAGVGWDEPLEGESLERWRLLIHELRICQPIRIPRCYSHNNLRACELHGFCDASTTAYAAVVYLLVKDEGDSTVKIIASKSRVAPLQTQTVPRLELLGALLLSRLMKFVINSVEMEIDIKSFTCYTDSLITLFWIKGLDRDWKPFVQNRVSEIRRLTGVENWRHCSGELNPADIPSRGMRPSELLKNSLWWNGPSFIGLEDINGINTSIEAPEGCLSEIKSKVEHTLSLNTSNNHSISNIMNIENYSTVKRVLNITMILIKFIDRLRKKLNNDCDIEYLNRAEQLWLQDVQSTLVNGKYYSQLRRQLDLFCDEKGVWRCGGRLTKAEFSYATKHPIILPRDHYYTLLVVKEAHCYVLHNGTKETLTQVRSRYWIAKGRAFVKRVLAQCMCCL